GAMTDKPWKVPRTLAAAAVAIGIAGGNYGIASAASGSGGSSSSSSAAAPAAAPVTAAPWGRQRRDGRGGHAEDRLRVLLADRRQAGRRPGLHGLHLASLTDSTEGAAPAVPSHVPFRIAAAGRGA